MISLPNLWLYLVYFSITIKKHLNFFQELNCHFTTVMKYSIDNAHNWSPEVKLYYQPYSLYCNMPQAYNVYMDSSGSVI